MIPHHPGTCSLTWAAWLEPATGILCIGIAIHRPDGGTERYYFGLNTDNGEAVYYAL